MEFLKLQNGSDIRGIAMEGVAGETKNLGEAEAYFIARAFSRWLFERTGKENGDLRVSIGRDSRLTGEALLRAMTKGLLTEGVRPCDFGLCSTPAMFMSTVLTEEPFDGACMITASHLPYNRNGIKFFTRGGGLEKAEIKSILEAAKALSEDALSEDVLFKDALSKDALSEAVLSGDFREIGFAEEPVEKQDFLSVYAAYLREKIIRGAGKGDRPLLGKKIIVDAGNGAGGFFADRVLKPLGADISGSCFLEPDGHFPNHIPNPENKAAEQAVIAETLASRAELGIIFDTDVDRAGAVLADGTVLTRNSLIALISAILLKEYPGTAIVTDSVTSTGLADFIAARGGIHRRFKRGYRNVINEAVRLNRNGTDCQLAMETSGHGALKENYFLDDGAYLMVRLVTELGKGNDLKELVKDLKEPAESLERRLSVIGPDVGAVQEEALSAVKEAIACSEGFTEAPDNFEGVRVNCDKTHGDGWFLIRRSLHDPIMPVNIESDTKGGSALIQKKLYDILYRIEGLDISPLS